MTEIRGKEYSITILD